MDLNKNWRQYFVAIIANLLGISIGISSGWTSPVGPKLSDPHLNDTPLDYPISETSSESGWITSLLSLGGALGPFIVWTLVDNIGRKWCLFIGALFFLISNILLIFSFNLWIIFASRLLQGFGLGLGMATLPIYLTEISSTECRGTLGSFNQLFITVGTSYVFIFGPLLSYTILQWACIPFPILIFATIWLIPETPYYYILKNQHEEAKKSLMFLRGQSEKLIENELQIIKDTIEKSLLDKATIIDLIKNKGNKKALIICLGLVIGQQLCGSNALLFNAQSIFEKSNIFDAKYSMIIVSIANLIVAILSSFVIDRCGRRFLLMASAIIMMIAMGGFAVFYYIEDTTGNTTYIGWLPIICYLISDSAYTLGFGPITWIIVGEIFSSDIKSLASAITVSFCWLLTFIVTQWYPLYSSFGLQYTFLGYSIICGISFIFVYSFVFETKDLTIKDIQILINS